MNINYYKTPAGLGYDIYNDNKKDFKYNRLNIFNFTKK